MQKIKILFIFIVLLSIPSYFILKEKNFSVTWFNDFKLFKSEKENTQKEESKEIIITEKELEEMLSKSTSILESYDLVFGDGKIIFTGELKTPKQKVQGTIIPSVQNQKLVLTLTELKFGFLNSPDVITKQIQSILNKTIDKNINRQEKIKSVIIRSNELVLITE